MSKALELAGELKDKAENPFEYSLETMANAASELRRLAQIERKYNEIMAQEPVAWLHVLDCGGGDFEYNFHPMNERPEGNYHLYTLKKD